VRGLQSGAATLTLVFTDLVGSTELRSRLGDDQADVLRREHDELIGQAVSRHDGVVVKGLGDGIMAAFAAPSAAVAAAADIQRSIERRNTTSNVPLALRVGVSAGEVRVEADDVFGTAVVEAARLCNAAEANQVLMHDVVRMLAGSRVAAMTRPMGSLTLKGLSEPVPTVEVEWWATGSTGRVPFPDIPGLERWWKVVGRRPERFVADQSLVGALTGKTTLLVLRGDAGAGKTLFAADVARRAARDGRLVLYGRADGTVAPHQPIVDALRHAIRTLPSDRLAATLRPEHAVLVALFPELDGMVSDPASRGAASPGGGEPVVEAAAAEGVVAAMASWLAVLAADEGAVLILDDLHQAAASTRDLVAEIVARGDARLLIIATGQSVPVGMADPLDGLVAAARAGRGVVEELTLLPLTVGEITAMVGQLGLGDDEAAELAATLHAASGGNALYATELVHLLRSTGWLVPAPGADASIDADPTSTRVFSSWALTSEVPLGALPHGMEVLRARLAALDRADQTVLRAAALVGMSLEVELVAAAANVDAGVVVSVLEHTDAARLTVRSTGGRTRGCSLTHDAYRWLLEAAAMGDAAAAHFRLADALEERVALGRQEEVFAAAHHRVASGSTGAATVALVETCADRSLAAAAPDAAVVWLDLALGLLGPAGDAAVRARLSAKRATVG